MAQGRDYEVQMLTPNIARPGLRWKKIAVTADRTTAGEMMEDIRESMVDSGISRNDAWHWAETHLRGVEVILTSEYGKSFHIGS